MFYVVKGHMSFKQRTIMVHDLKMERTAAKREVILWTMEGGGRVDLSIEFDRIGGGK